MEKIGIITHDVASKYLDLDNYILENGKTPTKFIIYLDTEGMKVEEYKEENDNFNFTSFSKDLLGTIVTFNTNKPEVYGTNLRYKLIGMYNNKNTNVIYLNKEDSKDNIYMFSDIYNNRQIVYIPEKVIIKNTIVNSSKAKEYKVTINNPIEDMLFKEHMRSIQLNYKEM